MGLVRTLAWLIGFGLCTFLFVVLFEHGWRDAETFLEGARLEFHELVAFLQDRLGE